MYFRHKFCKRVNARYQLASRAFTLIELLVVIAIIALLLAILGPSLGKATDMTEDTICRSNLKQWALVFTLYANDNEDSFPQSIEGGGVDWERAWLLGAWLPYYEDLDLRMCPSTKSSDKSPAYGQPGGTFLDWGPFPPSPDGANWYDALATGSYGFNDWCADPPLGVDTFWGLPSANAVRKTTDQGAYMTPVVYDCVYCDSAPKMNDWAPNNNEHETDDYDAWWDRNGMKFNCIDRHRGGINAIFVDMDARHVGVKEQWLLKWHANWEKCSPPNAWPTWTDKYEDY